MPVPFNMPDNVIPHTPGPWTWIIPCPHVQ